MLKLDELQLVADHLNGQELLAMSHSSQLLREAATHHRNGCVYAVLPQATPKAIAERLDEVFNSADLQNRRVGIVASPTAIGSDVALGETIMSRIEASSQRILWLDITLPPQLAARLRELVQKMVPGLRALHLSFDCDNNAPQPLVLELSNIFSSAPCSLENLSIVSEGRLVALPTHLGGLRNVRYLQLRGLGDNGGWPADWRAAVTALADYVPTLNVSLGGVDAANVDIGPLLLGLGTGPLVLAFVDTCVAPGHTMVSAEDGSAVRRLQWGRDGLEEGLARRIYTQVASIANQIAVVHIDAEVLSVEVPPKSRPPLPSLRQIIVHSMEEPTQVETPADRAARVDAGGLEKREELEEFAAEFFLCGNEVEVTFWCPHCGNPEGIPAEVRDRATATPGPSA